MKIIKILLFLTFFHNNLVFAQFDSPFNKGFKTGFQEGYCYNQNTVDCLTPLVPLPPLPRLNEKNDSYTDGYNRGFQTGLDLKRLQTGLGTANGIPYENIPNYRFNDYIPQNPVDAMVKVGIYKQKLFDIRFKWAQQRINDLYDFNSILLKQLSPEYYLHYNKMLDDFIDTKLNGQRTDYSDNYYFNQMVSIFNTHERNIYNTYQSLINEANSIIVTEPDSFRNTKIGTAEVKHIDSKLFVTIRDKYDKVLPTSDYKSFSILNTVNPSINDDEVGYIYSQTNNSYWSFNVKEISKIPSDTYTSMNLIGNSNALYVTEKENRFWLFYNGIQVQHFENDGIKTYKTSSGTYSRFQIFRDTDTNRRYFIPKEISENGLYFTPYPIFSK